MKIKGIKAALYSVILASFAAGLYFYPRLPREMASHWDAAGQANGHSSRILALFLIPAIMAGLVALFKVLPKADPLRKNYRKFKKHYEGLLLALCLFLFSVHIHLILWNIGIRINTNIFMPAGAAGLFLYLGTIMESLKRNWFVGIRTPWTLSSDKVWSKTHRLGGKLFLAAGIIAFLGIFAGQYAIYFIVFPVLAIVAFSFVYSYLQYKK